MLKDNKLSNPDFHKFPNTMILSKPQISSFVAHPSRVRFVVLFSVALQIKDDGCVEHLKYFITAYFEYREGPEYFCSLPNILALFSHFFCTKKVEYSFFQHFQIFYDDSEFS